MDGTPAAWPAYLRFTIRRALRVMPLVTVFTLTCLVIALLTQSIPASQAIGQALGAIFYVDNLICWVKGLSKLPYTMHLWTLSYEMQFYPFIPLFAAAAIAEPETILDRLGDCRGMGLRNPCELRPARRVALGFVHDAFHLADAGALQIGFGVLYLTGALPRISWWVALPLAAVGFACVAIAPPELHAPYTLVVYPALALTAAGTLWAAIFFAPVRWLLSLRSLVFLGKISYGLYVFHLPAIAVFKHMAPNMESSPRNHSPRSCWSRVLLGRSPSCAPSRAGICSSARSSSSRRISKTCRPGL